MLPTEEAAGRVEAAALVLELEDGEVPPPPLPPKLGVLLGYMFMLLLPLGGAGCVAVGVALVDLGTSNCC